MRLIDADELRRKLLTAGDLDGISLAIGRLDAAPTVDVPQPLTRDGVLVEVARIEATGDTAVVEYLDTHVGGSGSVPALFWPDDENPDMPFSLTEADMAEMLPDALDRQVSAMFAALADALARDAKVAEIVAKPMGLVLDRAIDLGRIAALYPEAGK